MSRQRDPLLASVAHDLRQPITVIDLAAHMLERMALDESARELLDKILEATRRLTALTAQLTEVGDGAPPSREVLLRDSDQ
jgi:signal transduction histidine kinase